MGTIPRRAHMAVLLLGATLAASRAASAQAAGPADTVYFEFQVEKPVAPLPGPRPVYPSALSAAHITGEVLVQFVVDTLGRPEVGTLKVLRTTNAPFADAVRDVLPTMRFRPAEIHGRLVKQLVQQPFVFTLD